jgi:hypothetical protein
MNWKLIVIDQWSVFFAEDRAMQSNAAAVSLCYQRAISAAMLKQYPTHCNVEGVSLYVLRNICVRFLQQCDNVCKVVELLGKLYIWQNS